MESSSWRRQALDIETRRPEIQLPNLVWMERASAVPAKKHFTVERLRNFLSYLRSLLFTDLLICIYTVVCGSLSLAGSLFDARGRWQHACARGWSWLILKTSGIYVKAEGLENVDPKRTTIYCANHPSAMDIPILLLALPVQFRFLAKRPLFRIPFLGWHLQRSGHIPVDRERPREALHSLDQAAKKIQEGRSVVLFPEGHRSRDGRMLPFKAGSFYLAIRAGVPIVPITLNGTRAVLKPDTLHVRPGETEVIAHPPIPTADLTLEEVQALSERVRNQILSRFRTAESED